MPRAPVICIPHGGGPLPLMKHPSHAEMVKSWTTKARKILQLGTRDAPRAIIVVTAHFSEKEPTISSAEKHSLYYDYYGFPESTYSIKYDAPGSSLVAQTIARVFRDAGFSPVLDDQRGWDHGVFIPLKLIAPEAEVPVIQLSVLASESISDHFRIGKALRALRDQNVAILGSGFASFHNNSLLAGQGFDLAFLKEKNDEWSKAVTDATQETDVEVREEKFRGWRNWPHADLMHPPYGGEHFMPLVVCAGAGGEGKASTYTDDFLGLDIYTYYWE
ncbi:Extradiol ring-cleavage dioxygenase, class III enzyme, subunit B [Aspergillus navahoensis]